MSRLLRNQLLESSLRAAGFIIVYPEDNDPGMEWEVREQTHRRLCAMYERDWKDLIQAGTSEQTAAPCTMSTLRDLAKDTLTGNTPVWILGPGAAYVARGFGTHLATLVKNENERIATTSKDLIK